MVSHYNACISDTKPLFIPAGIMERAVVVEYQQAEEDLLSCQGPLNADTIVKRPQKKQEKEKKDNRSQGDIEIEDYIQQSLCQSPETLRVVSGWKGTLKDDVLLSDSEDSDPHASKYLRCMA